MRILSLIASLGSAGGAEMLVRKLSVEFANAGHDCHVVYLSAAEDLGASVEFEQCFKEELAACGVSFEMLGHETRRNPLLGASRLRTALGRFQPDIIHAHLAYALIFQAAGLVRLPTVYTHHNIITSFPPVLFRLFDLIVDEYVGICGPCEEMLRRKVKRPVRRIDNGVPSDFVEHPRIRTGIPRDINILSVGNLTPQKDYGVLVEAAASLVPRFQGQGRNIRFKIAGEGPERANIEQLIGEKGLSDHVELLGTRTDVPALMDGSELLVMSSKWEGLPITLIEAAMAGLPAVATDVGGCSDIVISGKTGYLVPPGQPAALAASVAGVLSDEEHYVRLSEAARQESRRFNLKQAASAHLELYRDVVTRRQRSKS